VTIVASDLRPIANINSVLKRSLYWHGNNEDIGVCFFLGEFVEPLYVLRRLP